MCPPNNAYSAPVRLRVVVVVVVGVGVGAAEVVSVVAVAADGGAVVVVAVVVVAVVVAVVVDAVVGCWGGVGRSAARSRVSSTSLLYHFAFSLNTRSSRPGGNSIKLR